MTKPILTLILSATFANISYAVECPVGSVLTDKGCATLIQPVQRANVKDRAAEEIDPRLNDRRCYDDGYFDPYDDDCIRAFPELSAKKGIPLHYDDDRWDD